MQNLNLAKTGGADRLLEFIHNLVNNLRYTHLVFCANPPFNHPPANAKAARRAESNGYFDVDSMKNDAVWRLFKLRSCRSCSGLTSNTHLTDA